MIYLKKGEWLNKVEFECGKYKELNLADIADLEELVLRTDFLMIEPFLGQIKSLSIFDYRDELTLSENKTEILKKFKNLEYLGLSLTQVNTIDLSMFDHLKYLSRLELEFHNKQKLPEFLFKNLTKLKELKLQITEENELNNYHFDGLENLQTFKLKGEEGSEKIVLNECLGSMVNLKHLELKFVILNKFTLLPFEKLEKLKLVDYLFQLNEPSDSINNNGNKFFENLKSLKYLELGSNRNNDFLYTIPSTVETFKTNKIFFESISSKYKVVPFINKVKYLVIKIKNDRPSLKQFNWFHEDCSLKFENLESVHLNGELIGHNLYLNTNQIKSVKSLNSLTLDHVQLKGIDAEFNYLTEASFSDCKIPENIVNFYNLEKLCLERIYSRIPLKERFLEELINLEDLKLESAFNSIDEDAQYLFKNLTKLKKLTMTGNNIKTIKSSYFEHLVNLEELNLSHNSHIEIEVDSFKNLKKLKHLDLSTALTKDIKKRTFCFNTQLERVIFRD